MKLLIPLMSYTIFLVGCSSPTGPQCHPVRGQVLINDKPVENAEVIFHPLDGTTTGLPPAHGMTDKDGRFSLSTVSTGDGAPTGEYAVTVAWLRPLASGDLGPDALKGKYGDPKKPAAKVTVKDGENEFPPFKLDSPK